ncbi:MAG: nucleotide sugar dehydrogenase [bacterium]|nr:nucleotide sugar dehydrogenase [bacterium]
MWSPASTTASSRAGCCGTTRKRESRWSPRRRSHPPLASRRRPVRSWRSPRRIPIFNPSPAERVAGGVSTVSRLVAQLKGIIADRSARIGVVGLGYVGLPLAVEFAQAGFRVTGIDLDRKKVEGLKAGKSHVEDTPDEVVAPLIKKRALRVQHHYRSCDRFDAILICVPTPLRKTKDPDISYIVSAIEEIARDVRRGQLIILESTTYPGTTEEVLRPRLEASGLRAGKDIFLAFSPERVDPGNRGFVTRNTPKVVGGTTADCTDVAVHLYRQAIEHVHPVSSTHTAEMVKLLENTFRAVNIALVNELALMCERLGLDVWEVIDGASTKPFGFMPFYPGPGIGGHCIPLDPHYLSWKMKTLNYSARFIELASDINGMMPSVVVRKAGQLLNDVRKSVNGSRVLVLGAAYKRDIGDTRESPALDIMRMLDEQRARLAFHDPFHAQLRLEGGKVYKRTPLTAANLERTDLVLLVTDHSEYDYDMIVRHSRLILDTRNATRNVKTGRSRIHRL